MNTLSRTLALFVLLASCAVVVHASPVSRSYTLYSLSGFTELLIEKGIIPPSLAERARALTSIAKDAETPAGALNADKVSVSVSQLIGEANLTFTPGEDITGPVLLVKNTTGESIILEAKRHCQIVYRIFDSTHTLLFSSDTAEQCTADERVTYELQAGKTRMFPVRHPATAYPLSVGTYTLEIEYPGYGTGERELTIE